MRIYRKPESFETEELCKYGCGKIAKFKTPGGLLICGKSVNSCEINKVKNSKGLKKHHDEHPEIWDNIVLSEDAKRRMNWNKGLTKETSSSVAQGGETFKRKVKSGEIIPYFSGKQHTREIKEQIGESRVRSLLENGSDTSGKRGHRGFYHGMFFHSSWELAFYVYELEVNENKVVKNTKYRIKYFHNDREISYIPDFISEKQNLIYEIKAYFYTEQEKSKFEQTKDKVKYLFKPDLKEHLNYCKKKYGNEFWNFLYLKK